MIVQKYICFQTKIDQEYHKYLLTVQGEAMFPIMPEAITLTNDNIAFITKNNCKDYLKTVWDEFLLKKDEELLDNADVEYKHSWIKLLKH